MTLSPKVKLERVQIEMMMLDSKIASLKHQLSSEEENANFKKEGLTRLIAQIKHNNHNNVEEKVKHQEYLISRIDLNTNSNLEKWRLKIEQLEDKKTLALKQCERLQEILEKEALLQRLAELKAERNA